MGKYGGTCKGIDYFAGFSPDKQGTDFFKADTAGAKSCWPLEAQPDEQHQVALRLIDN